MAEPKRRYFVEIDGAGDAQGVFTSEEEALDWCDRGTILVEVLETRRFKVVSSKTKLEEIKPGKSKFFGSLVVDDLDDDLDDDDMDDIDDDD